MIGMAPFGTWDVVDWRTQMEVTQISFDDLKSYWVEVDHFGVPDKIIREVVRRLGPYESLITDPRRASYGLFDGEHLVGVTHLMQWNDSWVRYRTVNIRRSHRGRDLGWFLLTLGLGVKNLSLLQTSVSVLMVGLLHWAVVIREETYLEQTFGDEYLRYKKTVRRWI